MQTLKVKIADLAVLRERGILLTVGLGSCVGIALHDAENKVGGLAHILLSCSCQFENRANSFNPAKFADTAIPLLVEEMEKQGGKRSRMRAKIAGGSQLFSYRQSNGVSIGERNIEAVRQTLKKLEIPIRGEDVGGNYGRTMRFFVETGKVVISTVGKGEKEL
jgi:chemotaxis protein CheD